jgi:hypothetical protein
MSLTTNIRDKDATNGKAFRFIGDRFVWSAAMEDPPTHGNRVENPEKYH